MSKKTLRVLNKVIKLHNEIESLLEPINEQLSEIIGERVFIMDQAGDGMVVVWGHDNNSAINLSEMSELVNMSKEDMLAILKRTTI